MAFVDVRDRTGLAQVVADPEAATALEVMHSTGGRGLTENFLGTCLGGRSEPIGGTIKGSTAQIVDGVD